jgi:hypothetical protein
LAADRGGFYASSGAGIGALGGERAHALASLGETAYFNLCEGDGIKSIALSPAQLDIG